MAGHTCERCAKQFKTKSQYDAHMRRKRPCKADDAASVESEVEVPDTTYLEEDFDLQRSRIVMEYNEANTKAKRSGRNISYPNQQEAAVAITEEFRKGKQVVILMAQPGTGKTGVALEVLYKMAIGTPDDSTLTEQMVICSGMSDCEWREQFAKSMLPSLKSHIYHRGNLPKHRKHLAAAKLVIDDECHIAADKDMMVSSEFRKAGLLDVPSMEKRGRKLLQISATPEAVGEDLKKWGDRAAKVVLQPGPTYKGFRVMLNEKRIRQSPQLNNEDQVRSLLEMFTQRYANTTAKYFPFRVNEKIVPYLESVSAELGWASPLRHDSMSRIEDIDEQMKKAPTKHTIIRVKGFWRASKRLVRDHVGGSYETVPKGKRNTTATAQGLTARFCDNFDYTGEYLEPNLRPIHFCDKQAIEEYVTWFESGCDFTKTAYSSARITSDGKGQVSSRKTKLHASNIKGLVGPEEEEPIKDHEQKFERDWKIFETREESIAYAREQAEVAGENPTTIRDRKFKADNGGFEKCTVGPTTGVFSFDYLKNYIETSRIGANMNGSLKDLEGGKCKFLHRRYVCYIDLTDISTVRYVTSWVRLRSTSATSSSETDVIEHI
ncbi:hypothetical protein EBZ80_12415 [bacterium]|nr:hypothetical protein [bacterium]